jgi:hypothetical protein
MAVPPDSEEYTTSVGAILVDSDGRIDCIVVMSDGESYYSRLTRINDIARPVASEKIEEQYGGNFWLTDMVRTAYGNFFLTDADGKVHTEISGAWATEDVSPGKGLRCIHNSDDGQLYAAGTQGIVFQRMPAGWEAISPPLGNWISAIGGPSRTNLLAVGDAGLAWRFDGTTWTEVSFSTNVNLTGILWAKPDIFTVCGGRGTIFRGNGDEWASISTGADDLFKLAEYDGQTWIACGKVGVGRLVGDGLEIMRSTFAGFRIVASGRFLAAAGNNIVARFDGNEWKGFGYG